MHTPQELKERFWKAIKSDRTVMLGLKHGDDGHMRPMTAQIEGDEGPVWIFTSRENSIAKRAVDAAPANLAFAAKGHELFCCAHGTVVVHNDPAVIARLWNPFVAAWYEGGKNDPKLVLLRLDLDHAEIWLNETSLFAGIRLMLGVDPKVEYKDSAAKVDLSAATGP
jgi:general stress protein 26